MSVGATLTVVPTQAVSPVAKKLLAWAVTALFLAALAAVLYRARTLRPLLNTPWDWFWIKAYAGAIALTAALIWWRRGKLLLVLAGVGGLVMVLTPVAAGVTGWALPKLALLTALAIGLGQRGLRWCKLHGSLDVLDRVLVATVLGYGILSLVVFGLGLLHLWRLVPALTVLIALGVFVARDFLAVCRQVYDELIRGLPVYWREGDFRLPALALACFCICGFASYAFAVAPATHWDVLHYHLGVPAIYLHQGGLVNLTHTFAAHLVRNLDMLYLLGLLVEGQPLPLLINFLFSLVAAGFILRLGTVLFSRGVGWLAACMFFAMPMVTRVAAEGLIDVYLTAYVLAAGHALLLWHRTRSPGWLTLASLLGGLAVGTKVNAVIFLGLPFALAGVGVVWPRRRFAEWAPDAARLLLPGALVAAPWFALTWARTGNPVFPFLNSIFLSPDWHSDKLFSGVDWSSFGVGQRWTYALRLPWDLAFHAERFGELSWYATAGLTLLGLPFTYFLAVRRERRAVVWLCLLIAVTLAAFFAIVQYARYMLPIFPAFALLAAFNCRNIWLLCASRPLLRCVPLALLVALGLGWLGLTRAASIAAIQYCPDGRYPWRLFLGQETDDDYLCKSAMQEYEALRFIREELGDVTFFGVGVGTGLYSGGAVQHQPWHSKIGMEMAFEKSPERLLTLLQKHGVEYLLFNQRYLWMSPDGRRWFGNSAVCDPQFLYRHAEVLFSRNGFYLYRLRPEGVDNSLETCPCLLHNGDLEPAADGATLPGWGVIGKKVGIERQPASRGAVVCMTHQDCLCQNPTIREKALYTLAGRFWAEQPGQWAMLQVVWYDADRKQLKNEYLEFPVTGVPQRYEVSSTAPAGAHYASIYVRAKDGSQVRGASFRFCERQGPGG